MNIINEPDNHISQDAVTVWRISNSIGEGIALIVLAGLLWAGYYFDWYHWIIIVLWVLIVLTPISAIWSVFMEPLLLQKYWRYGINEEFVQLKHGILNEEHIIIPMTKVQYVEAKQGPLLRKYKLYTLSIGTMQSSHSIPALPEHEALMLRDEIAHKAKLKEVD
ncbi:PH domain-containing protein [Virgibacillus dakarensis]|uniref:UPF0699 transmembrane protein YdbS n=1 Tax=Lentibacillus populi TaxID=1827502 RepID=A0A9W5U134_9BACI|nr:MULTISPECIES: PH domain-containing protein [Bacillaceae]MBT2218331.1 PH domain-containing protein [Virgibacillus dakarensis]MTW85671.1 PH domain-containing protein [Virgibacillus dakarensis]GGB55662.1 UPF0699 transmembrane protein YdbS [Lentibacillus populi]